MTKPRDPKKPKAKDRHVNRKMVGLDGALHEQLKRLAEQEGRPLSWQLRQILRKALQDRGLWPPPPQDGP